MSWYETLLGAQETVEEAERDVTDVTDAEPFEEVMRALAAARTLRQRWDGVEKALERCAAEKAFELRARKGTVPGLGAYEVRGGRRWDWSTCRHDAVAAAVVDAHLEQAGGEVEPNAIAGAILAAAGLSYWRGKVLGERGIELGEYATRVESRRTVQFFSEAEK